MIIRRAFDIGSGSIKCQVAEVDTRASQIVRVLYARTQPVLFISSDGLIAPSAQAEGVATLASMLEETRELNATASAAVATEAFRSAANGATVVGRMTAASGVPISIVPAAHEARLSFLSARALRRCSDERLVAWDAGAGSFQLSNGSATHSDRHGSATVHAAAARMRCSRRQLLAGLTDYLDANLLPPPHWFTRTQSPPIVAVGSAQSIFNQCRVLRGSDSFTQADVESVLSEVVALDDTELHALELQRGARFGYAPGPGNVPYVLPKLALLLSVMRKFRMDAVDFCQTHGNCAGVLVDSSLWTTVPDDQAPSTRQSAVSEQSTTACRLLTAADQTTDASDDEQTSADRLAMRLTVNWHLQKTCNYKCLFCYAHFADASTVNLDVSAGMRLLNAMKEWGAYKVNFAGGEPLLNAHLGAYLAHARAIGLKTSIITNASRLTWSWLQAHAPYLDQVGISCDSVHEHVNKQLGRGNGAHVAIAERAFQRLRQVNASLSLDIKAKLNTVVTRLNHAEDWSDFVRRNGVRRWKVFKVLRIDGENDHVFDQLDVSDAEFAAFKARHAALPEMVAEDNDDMTASYLMVTPDGKFFQNTDGRYAKSQPILDIGMQAALQSVGFDARKFCQRGGAYSL